MNFGTHYAPKCFRVPYDEITLIVLGRKSTQIAPGQYVTNERVVNAESHDFFESLKLSTPNSRSEYKVIKLIMQLSCDTPRIPDKFSAKFP